MGYIVLITPMLQEQKVGPVSSSDRKTCDKIQPRGVDADFHLPTFHSSVVFTRAAEHARLAFVKLPPICLRVPRTSLFFNMV